MKRVTQITDMTKAVITDSLASVAIENVCDNIQEEIQQEYNSISRHIVLSWAGDFPIEIQKTFYCT